jgi:hypothetical protein
MTQKEIWTADQNDLHPRQMYRSYTITCYFLIRSNYATICTLFMYLSWTFSYTIRYAKIIFLTRSKYAIIDNVINKKEIFLNI